jgi:hypothetical protein
MALTRRFQLHKGWIGTVLLISDLLYGWETERGNLIPETCRRKRLFHTDIAVDTAVAEEGNPLVIVFWLCIVYCSADQPVGREQHVVRGDV